MKKLHLLLGLAVAVAALVFLLIRSVDDSQAWPALAPRPEAAAPNAPEATSQPPAPAGEDALGTLATAESSAGERTQASTSDYDSARRIRVRGTVEVPPGTPGNEVLEVLALRPERPVPKWSERTLLGESGVRVLDKDVLARAPVSGTGSFELELDASVESAHLFLDGRYLYVSEPRLVERADAPQDVRLTPRLGGWVHGALALPKGSDASAFGDDELRIQLVPDVMSRLGMGGLQAAEGDVRVRLTRARDELSYGIGGVAPSDSYRVNALPERLALAKSSAFSVEPGQDVRVDLAFTTGGTIRGHVRDEAGGGLEGVEVRAEVDPVMFSRGGTRARETKSAADGTYELAHVAPGALVVSAEFEGYLQRIQELELSEGETKAALDLVLERGETVAGRVHWPDGSATPDAKVQARFDVSQMGGMGGFNAMRGARGDARTDEDGRFAISGLGKGPFTVKVEVKRDGAEWRARVDGVKPGSQDLDLALAEPAGIRGRVVDEAGQPVKAFEVLARTKTGGMFAGLGGDEVDDDFEDENGAFVLEGLSEGNWQVRASAKGFGRGVPVDVHIPQSDPEATLELTLPHAASVAGVVVDPTGKPVARAHVGLELTLANMGENLGNSQAPSAESDDQGAFLMEGLSPGSLAIVATSEQFARSQPAALDLSAGERREGVRLTLTQGGRIVGEIWGKDGKPLAGATILTQDPSHLTSQRFANSDGEGKFLFEHVAAGNWQVMTMPERKTAENSDPEDFGKLFADMKMQMAEVVEGQDTFVVLGAPAADPVHLHGRVLIDGEPVPGVLASFIPEGSKGMQQIKIASVDKSGGYEVDLDQPGPYLVQVQNLGTTPGQQQSVQLSTEFPKEKDVAWDIALPVGSIRGRVRGADGKLLAGARITLSVDGPISNKSFFGGQYAEVGTDADGRYELVWLRAGTYTVSAGGPTLGGLLGGDEAGAPGRQSRSGIALEEGQQRDHVDFDLREPGTLVGVVREPGGKPVAGAAIFLRNDRGELLERFSFVASDSAGRFRYAGLSAGSYAVSARDGARATAGDVPALIKEGQDNEVELTLVPGTMLVIVLSDRAGEPIDCALRVLDEKGRQVNGNWSFSELMALSTSGVFSSKEQRVGPLSPGHYTVEATPVDGSSKPVTKPVTLNGQAERRLNLRVD